MDFSYFPDNVLALAVAAGSRAAFDALIRRFRGPLAVALYSQLGHWRRREPQVVEDARQRLWLAVEKAVGKYDPNQTFGPWLMAFVPRVAANLRRQLKRRASRERPSSSDWEEKTDDSDN